VNSQKKGREKKFIRKGKKPGKRQKTAPHKKREKIRGGTQTKKPFIQRRGGIKRGAGALPPTKKPPPPGVVSYKGNGPQGGSLRKKG